MGIVDLVSIGFGLEGVGGANYAFQWLFAHQLGFAYADGTLQRWGRRGAAWLAAVGLGALVLLTTVGGYPVSLVGVPGQERSNAQPPSLAMVALTLWLVGLALLWRPAGERWLARPGARRLVARVHAVVLTAFLWHVTAITVGAGVAKALGAPEPAIGSGLWWALRPAWLVWLLPFLARAAVGLRALRGAPGGPADRRSPGGGGRRGLRGVRGGDRDPRVRGDRVLPLRPRGGGARSSCSPSIRCRT